MSILTAQRVRLRWPATAVLGALIVFVACGDKETGPGEDFTELTQATIYPIDSGRAWRYVFYSDESGAPLDTATLFVPWARPPESDPRAVARCWDDRSLPCVNEFVGPDSVVELGMTSPPRVTCLFPMHSNDRWLIREVLTTGPGGDTLAFWDEVASVALLDHLTLRTGLSYTDLPRIDETRIDLPHGGSPAETTLIRSRYLAPGIGLVCTRSGPGDSGTAISMELQSFTPHHAVQPWVAQFTADAQGTTVRLQWRYPPNATFASMEIRFAPGAPPLRPSEGAPLPNGHDGRFTGAPAAIDSFVVPGLVPDTAYYFSAFAYDIAGNASPGRRIVASTGAPSPADFLPRTTPVNLLRNLITAYRLRNVAQYESLLAQDFTFVLTPEDQRNPVLVDQWGRRMEIDAHAHMFDARLVRQLTAGFDVGDVVWNPDTGLYTAPIRQVDLTLCGATLAHPGEVKLFEIRDSRSRFWFRKNGWLAPGTPDSVWSIVRWEDDPAADRPPRDRPSDVVTWGALKYLYL